MFFEAHAKSATMLSLTFAHFHRPKWAKCGGFIRPRIKSGATISCTATREGPDKKRAKNLRCQHEVDTSKLVKKF